MSLLIRDSVIIYANGFRYNGVVIVIKAGMCTDWQTR